MRTVVTATAVILSFCVTTYWDFPSPFFLEQRYQRFPGGKRREGLTANLETANIRMPELKIKHLENVNM